MSHVWQRLILGVALAASLIVGLDAMLRRRAAQAVESIRQTAIVEPPSASLPATVVGGTAWLLYLVGSSDDLPPGAAPVAMLASDGSVRIVRPAPVASDPVVEGWLAVGIVLPDPTLSRLTPAGRAQLLELLRRWRGDLDVALRPRVLLRGVRDPEGLDPLLRHAR